MADTNYIYHDGRVYNDQADVPDFGSFERGEDGVYYGYSADVSKLPTRALPKYENLPNGTAAYCGDTQEVYIFFSHDNVWRLQ